MSDPSTAANAAPVLVLGMHRSGTSCLAGLFKAAGFAPPGPVVRNWDNRHGHHEATAVVRLNDEVLGCSGGHWLKPPVELRWDTAHAVRREALLAGMAAPLVGAGDGVGVDLPPTHSPVLFKDPRILLTLPFWLASPRPRTLVGIVRHPLAVARSWFAQRQLPLAEGLALYLAYNRPLLGLVRDQGIPLLDFDAPREAFLDRTGSLIAELTGQAVDRERLAMAYDPGEIHHDGEGVAVHGDDAPPADLLAEAEALHRELVLLAENRSPESGVRDHPLESRRPIRHRFPWDVLARARAALVRGDHAGAVAEVRRALADGAEPQALIGSLSGPFLRARAGAALLELVQGLLTTTSNDASHAVVDPAWVWLVTGKAHLDLGQADAAVVALERACAGPDPYYEARHLRAEALRRAGCRVEAVLALEALLPLAVHPHQLRATLGEWAMEDGRVEDGLAHLQAAVVLAPVGRRGRLRSRCADLLERMGQRGAAIAELELALVEDPAWSRARDQHRRLTRD